MYIYIYIHVIRRVYTYVYICVCVFVFLWFRYIRIHVATPNKIKVRKILVEYSVKKYSETIILFFWMACICMHMLGGSAKNGNDQENIWMWRYGI